MCTSLEERQHILEPFLVVPIPHIAVTQQKLPDLDDELIREIEEPRALVVENVVAPGSQLCQRRESLTIKLLHPILGGGGDLSAA